MKNKLVFIIFFALLLILNTTYIAAQDDYVMGLLSQATVTYTTPKKWTFTGKGEHRTLFYEGVTGQGIEEAWRGERIIIGPMVSKRVTAKGTLALGLQYQAKWDDTKPTAHSARLQIQYSISNKYAKFRTTHRFLFDPAFEKEEPVSYRLRYRYNMEVPLNGSSVDVGEWYMKFSLENLINYKERVFKHEIRVAPFIGYLLHKEHKLELGLDYRFAHPFEADFTHQAWLNIGWYYSITAKAKQKN